MKTCSYCLSDIADGAKKCRYCQEYQTTLECTACCASLPEQATVCRFCNSPVAQTDALIASIPPLTMRAERLPTLLFRFRLLPQEISTDPEKIVITTPGSFRLWQNSDEIQWSKVAGFSYRTGIFWDRIDIETRGQKPSTILALHKSTGEKLRQILQKLEV